MMKGKVAFGGIWKPNVKKGEIDFVRCSNRSSNLQL